MSGSTADTLIEKSKSGRYRFTIYHRTTGDLLHRSEDAYEREADAKRGFHRYQKAIASARIRTAD